MTDSDKNKDSIDQGAQQGPDAAEGSKRKTERTPRQPGGLSSGLQPGGTAPGGGPGASVGSIGTGGGSTGGGPSGGVKKSGV